MQKLIQLAEGEYFLGNQPVRPLLVYGPIMYTYNYANENNNKAPIDFLVEKIRLEAGVDLEKIADSYHSGGILVKPEGKKIRHEIIMFFKSIPKPSN